MKSYKQLKKQLIQESEYVDGGALGQWPTPDSTRSAADDVGIHRIELDSQVQKLQAFLHAFTSREYLDPRAALSLMRVKLNLAGLDFDFNKKTEISVGKPLFFKLNRFGGTFGTTPDHDLLKNGFKVTDGVEDILGGQHLALSIVISEAESGLYKMEAKIVRYSDKPEQGDVEVAKEIE
jgi:hypothetical protein